MDAVTRQHDGIELRADLTVGDGFQEMLVGALIALHRHGSPAKVPGIDAVHRFRVGVRRLRSILSAFRGTLPERERRALSDRLRAVAQRYGRVREWDVFLAHTVAPLRAMHPHDEALVVLERLARKARRQSLPPGDTLKSGLAVIDSAIEQAAPWLRNPAPELTEIWRSPLRSYARDLLGKPHRRLRKRVQDVDLTDQAAFHQLRIRVKKLRYPVELMKSIFDSKAASEYLSRLVALQDLMGRLNDATIARGLLSELDPPDAAQHQAAGWIAHEITICRDGFRRAARQFRRAEPFWED
jgi:CHAD domain-containing protein